MTDEMTDVSTVKTACVVVRYFDQDAQKICSTFWELYKVFKQTSDTDDTSIPTANAENLYRALIDSLTNRNVPLTNMIGFGSDGCNVMMGDNDSVKQGSYAISRNHNHEVRLSFGPFVCQ
ncbi:hypothetical protein EVAR_49048_1 [Eumeta japonica]|uniref:DUF4371 domain-containing protein n=1 Tax=Eumeta variegata TaxID=151549 RepID=A0A4C2A131_EUMVA|nr:hypothetical protein EVAR_49048_1 [Eumeta japonica]